MTRWMNVLCLLAVTCMPANAAWILDSSALVAERDGVRHVVKKVSDGERSVALRLALFETPRHRLRVIDAPAGARVPEAVRAADCIAGINGGYFHAGFEASGLVVSGGRKIHQQQKARLLSGVVAATKDRVHVLRHSEFKLGPRTLDAIQAGPFLVDSGKPVAGLDAKRRAYRSAILTDGRGRHALLVTESLTLRELADVLATPGMIEEFELQRALNLDGGTSTGFYFAGPPAFSLDNVKKVRNCLGIVAP